MVFAIIVKMDDWKYTFAPVSKAEWLAQMEKDLLGKTSDSLETEWWPGEPLVPYQHQEDVEVQIVSLPDAWFQQPPSVMEWIETPLFNTDTIRQKIRDALNFGTQSMVFDTGKNGPDFGSWYEDVFPDMIETGLLVTGDFDANDSWMSDQLPFNTYLRLKRGEGSSADFLKPAITIHKRSKITFRFAYEIPGDGIWTDKVVSVFQKIVDDFAEWNSKGRERNDFLANCILEFNPDDFYFKQILQTRTLQIVWLYFCKSMSDLSGGISSPVECHIRENGPSDPDKYLVRASASALGAALTGVHSICIHHSAHKEVPSYYERITRNIHHLLNLESEMYKGVDPLAGAYTVDYYTRKWSEVIWSRIMELINVRGLWS